jgi:hypothetical protein
MEHEGSLPYLQQPPLAPILNQTSQVYTLKPYLFNIHLNIIIPVKSP